MTTIAHSHVASSFSTNSELSQAIIQSFHQISPTNPQQPHFAHAHLLTADSQTNGRGQHGRSWQSPIGNVYLSLYIPFQTFAVTDTPQLQKLLDGRLSLCVAYHLVNMLMIQQINQQNMIKIGVKWVNDLGFYQHGIFQKLSGILIEPVNIENRLLGVIVGVGLNICQAPELTQQTQEGLAYQAICLADFDNSFKSIDNLKPIYHDIQTAIIQAIIQFNEFNHIDNIHKFIKDFAEVDVLKNQRLRIDSDISKHPPIFGIGNGIDNQGCLKILQDNDEQKSIWSGNIRLDFT